MTTGVLVLTKLYQAFFSLQEHGSATKTILLSSAKAHALMPSILCQNPPALTVWNTTVFRQWIWTLKRVILQQCMRCCQTWSVPRPSWTYNMGEIIRTLMCIYRNCNNFKIELSERKGSVTYGVAGDISLPSYMETVIWTLALKAITGSKSRRTSFGATLWHRVERYCYLDILIAHGQGNIFLRENFQRGLNIYNTLLI